MADTLEDAIREQVAEDPNLESGIVTGWTAVAAVLMPDGTTFYGRFFPSGQPYHITAGLTQAARQLVQDTWDAGTDDNPWDE